VKVSEGMGTRRGPRGERSGDCGEFDVEKFGIFSTKTRCGPGDIPPCSIFGMYFWLRF